MRALTRPAAAHLWTIALVLLHTLLVTGLFSLANGMDEAKMVIPPWFTLLILATLLLVALLSVQSTGATESRAISDELTATRAALEETRVTCEENVEKQRLEIAVINGSLNREIAERMQAEAQATKLRKQFELILNSAGEGIIGLDIDGNFIFVNTAAALMVDYDAAELIGKSHHDLIHHSRPDGTRLDPQECLIQQAYRDGIVHASSNDVFWTKEGDSFPVEYVSTPIVENGQIRGAVVVFRDLSTFA